MWTKKAKESGTLKNVKNAPTSGNFHGENNKFPRKWTGYLISGLSSLIQRIFRNFLFTLDKGFHKCKPKYTAQSNWLPAEFNIAGFQFRGQKTSKRNAFQMPLRWFIMVKQQGVCLLIFRNISLRGLKYTTLLFSAFIVYSKVRVTKYSKADSIVSRFCV